MAGLEASAAITGIGQSQIGRRLGRSGYQLAVEACLAAIADAGLTPDDIDGVATHPGPIGIGPGNTGAGAQDVRTSLGLRTKWHTGGLETGGQLGPVIDASMAVACGIAEHVLCFRSTFEATAQMGGGRSTLFNSPGYRATGASSWTAPYGAPSGVVIFALLASRYVYEFGLTREQMSQIALVERRNALDNPEAIMREAMTIEDYFAAPIISTPFCLYDCDVPVDGATAVVVSRREATRGLRRDPIHIEAVGCAQNERFTWDQRTDLTTMTAHDAASALWDRTLLGPKDVQVAEIYDGFSFIALVWLEALGFCAHGEAGRFVQGGERIGRGGVIPINTNGGQLSAGRLLGYGLLHEACVQLWGDGGARQVQGQPEVAVAAAGGGPEAGCLLLRRA